MKDKITDLFGVRIVHEQDKELDNSYREDSSGKITHLKLTEIQEVNIKTLFPLVSNLQVLNLEDCGLLNGVDLCLFQKLKKIYFEAVIANDLNLLTSLPQSLDTLHLKYSNIGNINEIKHFISLKEFELHENNASQIFKSSVLSNSIERLVLFDCEIENLKGISRLKNLSELDLSSNNIENIKELKGLPLLKKLLLENTCIDNYSVLSKLEILEELSIAGNKVDIDQIEAMPNLKKLSLNGCELDKTDGLEKFTCLTELNLSSNKLERIEGLKKLFYLKNLDLSCMHSIKRIRGLDNLKNLTKLDLSSCRITKIEGLENLQNLEVLYLEHNSITQIEGLENLTNLKELNLSNYIRESDSPLTEIQGVEHLNKLEHLVLTGHEIKELKNLPVENLRSLDISWNKIEHINYDWLRTLKHPFIINLTGNPLEIISRKIPKHVTVVTK